MVDVVRSGCRGTLASHRNRLTGRPVAGTPARGANQGLLSGIRRIRRRPAPSTQRLVGTM